MHFSVGAKRSPPSKQLPRNPFSQHAPFNVQEIPVFSPEAVDAQLQSRTRSFVEREKKLVF